MIFLDQTGPCQFALCASVAGYTGLPGGQPYSAPKAGLINLAESLHLDLHPRGIGVWLIDPGFVETPLTAQNTFRMPGLISAAAAAVNANSRRVMRIFLSWEGMTNWSQFGPPGY